MNKLLFILIPILVFLISLLIYPNTSRLFIYLNLVKIPSTLYPLNYSNHIHENIIINTHDDHKINAWILYKNDNHDIKCSNLNNKNPNKRVVLYFHGNAGTRGQSRRYTTYQILRDHFHATVIAIDYRGFSDNEGYPTENGLFTDARSTFDYAVNELEAEEIYLWGHSLGTGVSSLLAEYISDHHKFKALFLEAPFLSMEEAANSHWIASPFWILPKSLRDPLFDYIVVDKFDTKNRIEKIKKPIMILHGSNDFVINVEQGMSLYEKVKSGNPYYKENNHQFELYLSDAGHNNILFQPDITEKICGFLDKLD